MDTRDTRASGNGTLLLVLGLLLLVVLVVPFLGGSMMGWGPWGMMGGYGAPGAPSTAGGPGGWLWGAGMALGWLAMLAFWGALIVGVVLLVRWLGAAAGGTRPAAGEAPLDILRRRFAAGELTQEEFERMRQALER